MKKKHIMGFLTCLLVLALVLPVLTGCGGGGSKYKIGISQIVTHPALDATRQGIIDGMTEAGYVEGEDVDYDYQTAEGDMTLVASIWWPRLLRNSSRTKSMQSFLLPLLTVRLRFRRPKEAMSRLSSRP